MLLFNFTKYKRNYFPGSIIGVSILFLKTKSKVFMNSSREENCQTLYLYVPKVMFKFLFKLSNGEKLSNINIIFQIQKAFFSCSRCR